MKLESIVHPLVAVHRERFLQSVAATTGQNLVVLDIPLLFETHGEDQVSARPVCCLTNCNTKSGTNVLIHWSCRQTALRL